MQIRHQTIKQKQKMKKVLILISMVAMSSVAVAQTGSWYAGGMLGFGSSASKDANDNKTTTTNWTFGPEVGTFLKDDIQLGIILGLGGSKEKNDSSDISSSSNFGPTLYARKFWTFTDNFKGFAGLYLNYVGGKTTDFNPQPTGDIEYKQSGFGAKIGVGVAYAIAPRFTLVGQYGIFGWQSVKTTSEGNDISTDSNFGLNVNTTGTSVFNVGIYYTFME